MASIETTYSAQDLARLLGVSDRWIQLRAKREGWQALPRAGRGGGKLWVVSSMPAEIRDRLASALLRQPAAITEENTACASIGSNICAPIGTAGNGPALSDRERAIVTARLAFCRELDRIAPLVGKKAAVAHLVTSSRMGELSPVLTEQLAVAFARRRGDSLTTRTLYRWYADYLAGGEAALAPKRTAAKAPAWASEFLFHYQKPQHPTVALAHAELCRAMRQRGELPPSVHACRRLLAPLCLLNLGITDRKLLPYWRFDTQEAGDLSLYADALPKLAPYMKISRQFVHERLKLPVALDEDDVFRADGQDGDGSDDRTEDDRPGRQKTTTRLTAPVGDEANKAGEETGAGQDALDKMCDSADAALAEAAGALLGPLFAEVAAGLPPEELEARLAELYPAMDATQLTDILTRLLFVAQLEGRSREEETH